MKIETEDVEEVCWGKRIWVVDGSILVLMGRDEGEVPHVNLQMESEGKVSEVTLHGVHVRKLIRILKEALKKIKERRLDEKIKKLKQVRKNER